MSLNCKLQFNIHIRCLMFYFKWIQQDIFSIHKNSSKLSYFWLIISFDVKLAKKYFCMRKWLLAKYFFVK